MTEQEMMTGIYEAYIAPETPVWTDGMTGWAAIATVSEFFQKFNPDERRDARQRMTSQLPPIPLIQRSAPPPMPMIPPQPMPYLVPIEPPKNKVVAGLLGIFLGSFGIHRFYLGYNGIGVLMLLITVLTCGYGGVITSIWGIVEGVLCLTGSMTDVKGQPLVG